MADIQGPGSEPITPREKKMYEQEYKHGVQLFQKALHSYESSDNPAQKEMFKDVMLKSMNVLNETARELKRQALLSQNEKIEKDFAAFNDKPDDKKAIASLEKDLEKAKNSFT
jgi:hypothetical protein